MVEATTLGARIASGVVLPLVKKLFVADQPGAALVDKPVRIASLVSFSGEKRGVTPKDVEKVADELVRRALKAAGPIEQPIEPGEALAVRNALSHTLGILGTLTIEDCDAVALGPEAFAGQLRARTPLSAFGLTRDAELFYDQLLHTACLHILNFFSRRSTFIARQQLVQTQQLARVVQTIDILLQRLPSQSSEDAAFESRYAAHIAERHGTLTIYGLDAGTGEWPLDTAYLSLEATRERAGHGGSGLPVPAEQVLAQHDQVLLRGVAGSGKTTLVQWLAVTAASRTYEHGLSHLIGRVPFVLPMRRILRPGAELPIPGNFLTAVACPIAGEQPAGWVERVLRARRGVLLVDGIDEIAGDRRESARRWLRELARTFPGNLWLVTSRPSAVPEQWLTAAGFNELTLSPMSRHDVATFVRRWHRAAGADESTGVSLLQSVRTTTELNRLATNPLMCGMLCALHRDRNGFLPQDRKSLYEAALSMLLERRDRERGLDDPGGVRIPYATQIQLLQRLAWWLIRNGRSEMDRSDALHIITQALPSLNLSSSAEEVYTSLLLRSGLLREPADGHVDFLHRTFQDYLGSRLAVQELDFDLLLNNADKDQWEDVVLLAIAHARPKEAERMLRRLVEQGTPRGKLLAAAGMPYAAEVAPAIRSFVEVGVRLLVPPGSGAEAEELARAGGELVLSLLPPAADLDDFAARHVVRTASELGSETALHFLTQFREHPSMDVQRTLAAAWPRFDRELYAREILAHLPRQARVTVRDTDDLHALRSIGGWADIQVVGAYRVEDLTELIVRDQLTRLGLEASHPVEGLAWLSVFPNLKRVHVASEVSEAVAQQAPDRIELITPPPWRS
ncbi:ATP-binding protein [Streptomyces longisporoflavus]|uniref:NACHT domain-containing protein n=1 Tax=Streptomyces longisporoflavus TaxID=28044 RepID=UPI00167DF667|nr:NACHT domain-containing protein [Streptomyces longisporoflavus]GGV54787.1 ATP-binding protein [Streptomyces longisporoflavus]